MRPYWPQTKVYLYAQAAFFASELEGSIISKRDLSLSFADEVYDYIRIEEVSDSQVKIISLDKIYFTVSLIDYLKDYDLDRLSTGKKVKPERSLNYQGQLLVAVRKKYEKFGECPVIDIADLWNQSDDRDLNLMTFWEIILTAHAIDGYIDLVNIGYEGVYLDKNNQEHPLPFAEIRVRSGNRFYNAIQPPKLRKVSKTTDNAQVFLEGQRIVCVKLKSGEKFQIARLQLGAAPCNLIQYLMANQNTDLTLDDIKENVIGFRAASDLTECVRMCGFNKKLKKCFFPVIKRDRLHFSANATLDSDQISELKNRE